MSKLKAFADNFTMAQIAKFLFERVENIVRKGKGENDGYQHFLLFLQCFKKFFYKGIKLSLSDKVLFNIKNPNFPSVFLMVLRRKYVKGSNNFTH